MRIHYLFSLFFVGLIDISDRRLGNQPPIENGNSSAYPHLDSIAGIDSSASEGMESPAVIISRMNKEIQNLRSEADRWKTYAMRLHVGVGNEIERLERMGVIGGKGEGREGVDGVDGIQAQVKAYTREEEEEEEEVEIAGERESKNNSSNYPKDSCLTTS